MLLLVILIPMILGGSVFFMPFNRIESNRRKTVLVLLGLNVLLSLMVLFQPEQYIQLLQLSNGLTFGLNADTLAKFFLALVCFVWTMVGIYSLDYIKHEQHHERFYGFFFLSLAAMNGVCISGNYMTLYLFFELLTLASMPLVLHTQTRDSIQAAKKYLYYSVFGASLGLLGFFFLAHF
ncbi:MAG: proton-conducting transporter membrane subunit, partial [Erysipelotrichaceae bacterium]